MAKKKETTTNAMRILAKAGVEFEKIEYDPTDEESRGFGLRVSEKTGISTKESFKTITLRGDKTGIFVVCVSACDEIDLKNIARVSGNKRAELVGINELLSLTGYIRGGVSPVGMKKKYPTYIEKSAMNYEKIAISGGQMGITLLVSPEKLAKVLDAKFF